MTDSRQVMPSCLGLEMLRSKGVGEGKTRGKFMDKRGEEMNVCACVCVRERERERERQGADP